MVARASSSCLEQLADLADVAVRELLGLLGLGDARALADLPRERAPDAVQVREGVRDLLVTGEVDACDTSHDRCSLLGWFRESIVAERTPQLHSETASPGAPP